MSYDPGIPNPQDKISQSQPKLRVNFNQLNAIFSIDHVEYNNASIQKRGFHRKVTYEAPITDPNISITDVATLYTKSHRPSSCSFRTALSLQMCFSLRIRPFQSQAAQEPP